MIKLRLDFPPSTNTYYRMVNNRMLISEKGRKYRQNVLTACMCQLKRFPKLSGRLSVRIIATTPDKRRRDLDNLLKATLDSLQHAGIYLDDSQIDDLSIIRSAVDKPGWLDITIIETKGNE
jgi:crossover junction endodeoxyribonuclease RusA